MSVSGQFSLENTSHTANLSTSPFAAQAKTPLDDDTHPAARSVRFTAHNEVFDQRQARSVPSSLSASTASSFPDRMGSRPKGERIDDASRAAANEALEGLLRGNERFREGKFTRCVPDLELLEELKSDYQPSAVVLCCSDARVPPELVLDQGLGDIYVIRVAGNVVNDFVLGSVLFAVENLGARLVMVMGHTCCTVVASAVHRWACQRSKAVVDTVTAQDVAADLQSLPDLTRASHEMALPASPPNGARAPASGKPGLLSRVFGHKHGSAGTAPLAEQQRGDARTSSFQRNSQSSEHDGRASIDRASLNPLDRIVHAVGFAVDKVASDGKGLSNFVLRPEDPEDVQTLAKGLKKQDSMEYTRARLAQARSQGRAGGASMHELRSIEGQDGVETVIVENTRLSAKSVLKGLVKNLSPEVLREVEVVSGRYSLGTGQLSILQRGWCSGRSIYFE